MRVFAVYNIKGGVGKTATAVNLAYLSARAGARTLIWDLDPQGAASFYFRVRPRVQGGVRKLLRARNRLRRHALGTDFDSLEILPADFSFRHLDLELDRTRKPKKRLAKLIRPLARDYDHVYLDCAPSVSLVSEGVFAAADALVVPTIPTTLSLRTLEQIADHLQELGEARVKVLPFFSMVDRRRTLHREVTSTVNGAAFRFLRTEIPYSSIVERMGGRRAPLETYAARSPAALAYRALWREVLGEVESWVGWEIGEEEAQRPPD